MKKIKTDIVKIEEEILEFWNKDKTFEKSLKLRENSKKYSFYDGPPFATGLPHYGHILASTIKDAVPRYQTMKGYYVERIWGWDCHGLPIENLLEKELGLKTKKDILKFGVDNFNEACRKRVLTYRDAWIKKINRLGRWVDMEHDYRTMDNSFMESVMWVFKKLWEKGLIYKGHKPMHICPRCETPLSNFEVTLGYKDVKDLSVYVLFKLKDKQVLSEYIKDLENKDVYFVVWTTTPWTLPGNTLLAISKDIDYSIVLWENKYIIIAKKRLEKVFKDKEVKIIQDKIDNKKLKNAVYEPLFPYFKDTKNAFKVVFADFVTTDEGTGIVHVAPGFGKDDFELGKREKVPLVQHVTIDGKFTDKVKDFAGLSVISKGNPYETAKKIIKYLQDHGSFFDQEYIKHSYPHCWRCDTPLLNYATDSWFVKVTAIKDELIKNNEKINWYPYYIKHGRFGNWLKGAIDWAISRNRYWGAPIPIWESEDGDRICIGSIKELEELSGQKVKDLHKHFVDKITIKKNGKVYKRVPEVFDCWFESGSMPYGKSHYPFENKQSFLEQFPADFIAEGLDQTRGWFYTLHVLATALTSGKDKVIPKKESTPAAKNIMTTGIILAKDGKKMSKRLKNYPEPDLIWNKYGADSLRLYLLSSPVVRSESLRFNENDVEKIKRKVFMIWLNMLSFLFTYADKSVLENKDFSLNQEATDFLDKYLLSKTQEVIKLTTYNMDHYDILRAVRTLMDFVGVLSNVYLRRSREKIRQNKQSQLIFRNVLNTLSLLFAPFAPFFSDYSFRLLHQTETDSVHLQDWPVFDSALIDQTVLEEMQVLNKIIEKGYAKRKEAKIKVRMPLNEVKITVSKELTYKKDIEDIIKNTLNTKKVSISIDTNIKDIELLYDLNITDELKQEGEAREIIRMIQNQRKKKGFTGEQKIKVYIKSWPQNYTNFIQQKTNCVLEKSKVFKVELVD